MSQMPDSTASAAAKSSASSVEAAAPVANICVYKSAGSCPVTVDVDASLSTGENLTCIWSFGDGGTGNGQRVTHTYPTAGDYNIELSVTDSKGRAATATAAVRVIKAFGISGASSSAVAPEQPASGPGGSQYVAAEMSEKLYGSGRTAYWIFEPAAPAPEMASLVIFLHGFGAENPDRYRAWLGHLARKNSIMIFPIYQEPGDDISVYYDSMMAALNAAFVELANGTHVRPDLERVAAFGHSFGGVLAANYAATCANAGMPRPKAVLAANPGVGGETEGGLLWQSAKKDYTQIPTDTLMLSIAGEQDDVVGSFYAAAILEEAPVPANRKNLITLRSDSRGRPALIAGHSGPTTGNIGNAMQWYGYWKWADALLGAAFSGQCLEYALGGTTQQRFMGRWSDGTAIVEPVVQ